MIVDVALYQDGRRVDGPEDISDLVEIAKRYGYYVVLAGMATLTALLFRKFKKSEWL